MFLNKIVKTPNETAQDVAYLKKSDLPLVLYGDGALANFVQKLLLHNGIIINHVIVGKEYYVPNSFFHHYPIERENDILNLFPKMNVILAFGNYRNKKVELLKNPAVARCIFFEPAAVQFDFGDYYNTIKEHASELENFYLQLADEHSRNLMVTFINAKISGNSETLAGLNVSGEQQYFPEFLHLSDDEVLVDVGAFDGDTILAFNEKTQGKYSKIYAFEPSKCNIEKLKKNTSQFNNIKIFEKGCFSCKKTLHFQEGGESSVVSNEGNIKIDVDALDNIVSGKVTFIKMDIEGSELEALKGAQEIIRFNVPRLAISLYHRPNDFFSIPQYIYSLNNSYKFYLRHYGPFCTELVLYAIPTN